MTGDNRIDMSLDEIIKTNRRPSTGGRGRGRGARGGRGGRGGGRGEGRGRSKSVNRAQGARSRSRSRAPQPQQQNGRSRSRSRARVNGGQQKRGGAGGRGGAGARRGRSRSRSAVSEMNQMLQRQMNLRSGSMGPRTRSMSRSRNLFNRDVDIRARSVSRARSMSRGRSVSRGRPGAANRGGRSRSKSVRREPRNMNDTWQHDRFTGRPALNVAGSGKLVVSNLDFGVTDTDIQELFSEFGRLKSTAVHYDISGRSLGTADVIYERKSDAIKALKQYDGVPLDGRPMKIEMTSDANSLMKAAARPRSASVGRQRLQGRVVKRGGRGGVAGRGRNRSAGGAPARGRRFAMPTKPGKGARGRGARGRGGRGGPKRGAAAGGRKPAQKPANKDQLDQELDSFMKER